MISKRASLLQRLFTPAASRRRCAKIPSSGIGWGCRGGMARSHGPTWPGRRNDHDRWLKGMNRRSNRKKRLCGSSSAELRIEARIQNGLLLGRFQVTDKAVFVLDFVEA